jgi:hypothetical protein
MKLLNNKDLKLALKNARECCPDEEVEELLSRDNIMLTDIFYGDHGIAGVLKTSLTLMESWQDSVGENIKNTFKKYVELHEITIN